MNPGGREPLFGRGSTGTSPHLLVWADPSSSFLSLVSSFDYWRGDYSRTIGERESAMTRPGSLDPDAISIATPLSRERSGGSTHRVRWWSTVDKTAVAGSNPARHLRVPVAQGFVVKHQRSLQNSGCRSVTCRTRHGGVQKAALRVRIAK